jgi:lysyl-tRNA synthetase class 2
MNTSILELRSQLNRNIRRFFDERGYLEVDTPSLAPALIPESCLEVFEAEYLPPGTDAENRAAKADKRWLIPSPEVYMKQILAEMDTQNAPRDTQNALRDTQTGIYQISHAFRNVESSGFEHSPEFSLLEYYTLGADYRDSLALTEELFGALGLPSRFERLSMNDAFVKYAGFDLYNAHRAGTLAREALRLGLDEANPSTLPDAAVYDLIFVGIVEPALKEDYPGVPVALLDYPAFVPCLAKQKDAETFERWELYMNGLELSNCYTEETDPAVIQAFIASEQAEKEKTALVPHKPVSGYLSTGLPACSGNALGVDRLAMVLAGKSRIESVLPFPF